MQAKRLRSILLFFLLAHQFAFSQINISGTVTDSVKKPISSASITLSKPNTTIIVAFAIANSNGLYTLQYAKANAIDTFVLKANAIGYKPVSKLVYASTQNISFALTATAIQLPNVSVQNKKPFLKYKADTLSYNVDSFAQKQDRTIGDVLRKMPGIEVDGNGKISYNGKAISNFYIDGDNLLDDKYNIATNSIAANMVKDVQVLENHQPIKVLKNATASDKVALNLNLKNKARLNLTAHAELGAGYTNEGIYDETLNLMAFKKKYKAINSFKANNSGIDIRNDVVSHNITDYYKQLTNDVPKDLLGLNHPGNPSIAQQRFLFNNAAIVNTNNSYKTSKDVQLKANVYYLYDRQEQIFNNSSTYYLPTDTFTYSQQQNTQTKYNSLYALLTLTSNKTKGYTNNKLLYEFNKQPAISVVAANGKNSTQALQNKAANFSNEFSFITTVATKNIVELYNYISYLNKPETLTINPGINENVFNNNTAYNSLAQAFNVPTYFANTYISYRKPSQKVLQAYKVGVTNQWQHLQSTLQATQTNNTVTVISDSFVNNLHWQHHKIYTQADYDWLGERAKISVSIPINWQHINYADTFRKENTFSGIFFNPTIRLKYATGIENYMTASYTFSNDIATVEDLFGGYILKNFNQLSNSQIAFKQSTINNGSIGFNYRKTIKIFFFNIQLSYTTIHNNFSSNTTLQNSLQKQTLIPLNNNTNVASLFSSVSKYLFKLKTTLALKGSVNQSQWNQLQNKNLLQYSNLSTTVTASVNSKIKNWLNANYSFAYNNTSSKNDAIKTNIQSTNQINQQLEVNIFPTDNWFIKLKAEDFYVEQKQLNTSNNYFFADAAIRYKFDKIKTDISLDILNIADTKLFTSVFVSANNLSQSSYTIRPRMLLLKAVFNF